MQEETYFSDGTNWVTNLRLIFGERQYPLDNAVDAEFKAHYPLDVVRLRTAIIVADVLAFCLFVVLPWSNLSTIVLVTNIASIIAVLLSCFLLCWREYRKSPSLRRAIGYVAIFLAMMALVGGLSFFNDSSMKVSPLCVFFVVPGTQYLFSRLDRRSTFSVSINERNSMVDVFTSNNRKEVENLASYARFALIKRARLAESPRHV